MIKGISDEKISVRRYAVLMENMMGVFGIQQSG